MNEIESKELEECARPLIKLLCEKMHPHAIAIVTPTGVEILEGVKTVQNINDYIID